MGSTRLFVGNLTPDISEKVIEEAFAQHGKIINVDLKTKPGAENDNKKFAFVTLSGSNYDIETCIKRFTNEDLNGARLYVTRARESFLERLQRERQETQKKEELKHQQVDLPTINPIINLGEKLNPRKRKISLTENDTKVTKPVKIFTSIPSTNGHHDDTAIPKSDTKTIERSKLQQDSDKKRMESIKKKRQDFKEKQNIIKSSLVGIDKHFNKKIVFSDTEDATALSGNIEVTNKKQTKKTTLFEEDDSDNDVNFEIKKQFEGKKGQKVLDLQSRYKSDKRFVLDERFIDDGQSEEEGDTENKIDNTEDKVDLGDADEKTKQLNILQDVLGVSIKTKPKPDNIKQKPFGMLRYDPTHPQHAKFLAPVEETKSEPTKKSKKNKKQTHALDHLQEKPQAVETSKIEVSKEQFYKVSDTLKETLTQPASFSLRSLFGNNENDLKDTSKVEEDSMPLEKKIKSTKVKNPLDPTAKNPFQYDSSDSETEEPDVEKEKEKAVETTEPKAVWKENLFFSESDSRLKDGLMFFNNAGHTETQKERRELKSVMKKRIYNKERKNQMFQKKIGGRKKSMKKSYRKHS